MTRETALQAYKLSLKGYNQKQIAKKLKKSESQISKDLSALKEQDEYRLGVHTVVEFLTWFERASNFWNIQNSEYQDLIEEISNLRIDKSLSNIDKLKLTITKIDAMRKLKTSQDKNIERIVYQAKEGQIISAIQLMKDMLVATPKNRKRLKLVQTEDNNAQT